MAGHAPSRKPRRRPPLPPPPAWSDRLYLRLPRETIGLFRFLLEAEENLAYMSVVDRYAAAVQVVFSPMQRKELLASLERMKPLVPLEFLLEEQ